MNIETSKYIAYLLRHKPSDKNLTMDNKGFVSVKELLNSLNLSMEELIEIVETDNKKRYEFNSDKTKIRAVQGHSIKGLDLDLNETMPPDILYHGTALKFIESIKKEGLIPKSRHHVHLSGDKETASIVGKRHGELRILIIDSKQMVKDGFKFYLSKNNVWLVDSVPTKYIKEL